jgi:hypothetical protein
MQNDILEVEVQEDVPDEEEEHDMIQGMDKERLRLGSEKRNRLSAIEYLKNIYISCLLYGNKKYYIKSDINATS